VLSGYRTWAPRAIKSFFMIAQSESAAPDSDTICPRLVPEAPTRDRPFPAPIHAFGKIGIAPCASAHVRALIGAVDKRGFRDRPWGEGGRAEAHQSQRERDCEKSGLAHRQGAAGLLDGQQAAVAGSKREQRPCLDGRWAGAGADLHLDYSAAG
jgi:hypothetical protein